MLYFEDKSEKPNSMINLLIDQCGHLEELMSLMRKQIEALSRDDTDAVSSIVSRRDEINRKLEVSQQQIDRKML